IKLSYCEPFSHGAIPFQLVNNESGSIALCLASLRRKRNNESPRAASIQLAQIVFVAIDHAKATPCHGFVASEHDCNVDTAKEQLTRYSLVCLRTRKRKMIVSRQHAIKALCDFGIVNERYIREYLKQVHSEIGRKLRLRR